MKKTKIIIIGIVLVLVAIIAIKIVSKNNNDKKPVTQPVLTVTTVSCELGSIEGYLNYNGTVKGLNEATIISQTAGVIEKFSIKVGQRVSAGQVIAQVENSAQKAAVEQAKAGVLAAETAYEKAQADLKRIENLHSENVATKDNLELAHLNVKSALAQLKGAEAALKSAEKMLSDTYIKSTISGNIASKDVEQGATLAPGIKIAQIVDINKFKIVIQVNERDIQKVQTGKKVTVKVEAFPDKELFGIVNTVGLSSAEGMRTFPVEIVLEGNANHELKSGMFATCIINTKSSSDAILVPEDAVNFNNDGNTYIFTYENGKAVRKIVKTGIKSNGKVEISYGISKDAKVITMGKERLTDGMIVKEK